MKRSGWLLSSSLALLVLAFSLLWIGPVRNLAGTPESPGARVTPAAPEHRIAQALPSGTPTSAAWRDALPPADNTAAIAGPGGLPTPAPGQTLVYFLPTDSVDTATVITLYNTNAVAQTVALRGFSYTGVQIYNLDILLPAYGIQRLVSDDIVSTAPASWKTPVPYITSFGDATYIGTLSLPRGVKVDGYTLYNRGTGQVDPGQDQGAVPLRFSTDALSVFLPTVQGP